MDFPRIAATMVLITVLALASGTGVCGQQVWTKCHITCRCLQNNSIGNFSFVIPVDRSPDIGHEAHLACKTYGHRVCYDGCNGTKFSFTYQVTSP